MTNRERIARLMHDTCERVAKEVGWKTQENCRVPWEKLPPTNQKVMLAVADALIKEGCVFVDEKEDKRLGKKNKSDKKKSMFSDEDWDY